MALTNSLVVLFIDVLLQIFLTKLLQQCFLFYIVVVIPGHNLGNSQVSVNRTIGPTLVDVSSRNPVETGPACRASKTMLCPPQPKGPGT